MRRLAWLDPAVSCKGGSVGATEVPWAPTRFISLCFIRFRPFFFIRAHFACFSVCIRPRKHCTHIFPSSPSLSVRAEPEHPSNCPTALFAFTHRTVHRLPPFPIVIILPCPLFKHFAQNSQSSFVFRRDQPGHLSPTFAHRGFTIPHPDCPLSPPLHSIPTHLPTETSLSLPANFLKKSETFLQISPGQKMET
jgi:hypothetical protein